LALAIILLNLSEFRISSCRPTTCIQGRVTKPPYLKSLTSFGLQWGMPRQVEAVYENGVLRPLEPLDLAEHEHVVVSVMKNSASGRASLAIEYIEGLRRENQDADPAPGIEEVRRRLGKIPGSMAADIVADRGEH
jgi:predicted DNA-binding antitoxin AbrB/MazE fold protein